MINKNVISKLEGMPIAVIPLSIGACTLSNVYSGLGFSLIKHITMWISTIVLISYLIKIFVHFEVVKNECKQVVPASLYPGITMLTMLLSSYILPYNNFIGKVLWYIAIIIHIIIILFFTFHHVLKGVNKDTFVPTWFVTYNGILVSVVVGENMGSPILQQALTYYGIVAFILIIPFMIYRLTKHPIHDNFIQSKAIILGPISLCIVSYINSVPNLNVYVLDTLYISLLISLVYILIKLPHFFSFDFHPGFAALTFPMAIGIVASTKMAGFLSEHGYEKISNLVVQIEGIQIYITTAIVIFIVINFVKKFIRSISD